MPIATQLLESVIRAEPVFAPAHAELARYYMTMGGMSLMGRVAAVQQSKAEALQALRLDPNLSAGYAALSRIQMQADRDWLGLTPKQFASGDNTRMGGMSKRGNRTLRKLLIDGARAVVNWVNR